MYVCKSLIFKVVNEMNVHSISEKPRWKYYETHQVTHNATK